MKFHHFLLVLLNLIVIGFLVFYFLIPGNVINYKSKNTNPNFIVGNNTTQMQFYPNMRFPTTNISYNISKNCSISKKESMIEAFKIIENKTFLKFYPSNDAQVNVICQNNYKVNNGMFIAGEGGPTKIISENKFNVILGGEILLIKNSNCAHPNVEIHELLHVLGFVHSKNKNNIMYPVSDCSQTLGSDIPTLLNKLYSIPSYPDLMLNNASASINGRYLNLNFSITNDGLAKSPSTTVEVYADNSLAKTTTIRPIDIGNGLDIRFANIFLTKIKTNEIKIVVVNRTNELSTDNNELVLTRKD